MSTQNTTTNQSSKSTRPFDTFSHSSPESLAKAAGINDRTATRLFNVAAMNGSNEVIVEMDTEKGRWLIEERLTGVSTNAIIGRAQADGPDGILIQNGSPASKVSYALGQMQRARQQHSETGEEEYEQLAHQYYHAAHSRVRLPKVDTDDDLSEDVTFGVTPTGENDEIGEWLPKQHITAVHTIAPDAQRQECFVVTKNDDALQAARGNRENVDVFVGVECQAYHGNTRDGGSYTQRKVEIDASPNYRPVMRALYDPTYTTYEDDLKCWRATLDDLETVIDHMAMNDIVVGIHPATVKAASTEFDLVLSDVYHANGGKSLSEAVSFELVQETDSTPNETESFDELSALDELPEMDSEEPTSSTESTTDSPDPEDDPSDTQEPQTEDSKNIEANSACDAEPNADSSEVDEPTDDEIEEEFEGLLN